MNRKKTLKLSGTLFLVLASSSAQSAFDSLCFFGTNDGAGPTMFHIFDWNIIDAAVWLQAVSNTAVVAPPGITVLNNPRIDLYFLLAEGLEYSAGVFPSPLPSGLWSITGSSTPYTLNFFPTPRLAVHPDAPFTCASTDFVP